MNALLHSLLLVSALFISTAVGSEAEACQFGRCSLHPEVLKYLEMKQREDKLRRFKIHREEAANKKNRVHRDFHDKVDFISHEMEDEFADFQEDGNKFARARDERRFARKFARTGDQSTRFARHDAGSSFGPFSEEKGTWLN